MIAFDSNVLIYYIEGSVEYSESATKIVAKAMRDGGSISVLMVSELIAGTKQPTTTLLSFFNDIKKVGKIKLVNIDYKIAVLAGDIRKERIGISLADAIHLASAIESDATMFYTNDNALLKLGSVKSLKISPLI